VQIRKEKIPTLRETVYRCRLGGSLDAVLVPRPGLTKKIAILAARYGSLDLEFKENGRRVTTPPGVAHFLEHQLFKKHGGDALMEFSRWGANSNAYTEYTSTCYYFVCSENFGRCLAELFKLVFEPEFERKRVENEKSIIEQEILMYEDMPDVRGSRNLLQALYRTHPVRIDIAGSAETIKTITPDTLYRCHREFYNPANVILAMAGDLEPQTTFREAEALMRRVRLEPREVGRIVYEEGAGVERAQVRAPMEVSRPRVMIGYKDAIGPDDPETCLRRDVETSILIDLMFGRSGEFFTKHYRTGLIDDNFGASYSTAESYGFSVIGAETERVEDLEREVQREIERARRGKFPRRDIERIKRKYAGRFLRSFDSPESAAFLMLEMEQRRTKLETVLAEIRKVGVSELARRVRSHFQPENRAISVIERGKP
jgi:predicted Zn-dependent peptidase